MLTPDDFVPVSRNVIGLDIGGANLKAAHLDGQAASVPFPLWQHPEQLADALTKLLQQLPPADRFAVTMTGELADCFETKAEGVDRILKGVEKVAAGRPIQVWQTVGEFVSTELAREIPILIAAANWHVLATWLGRSASSGFALMLDIGSTTTDIIPILNGGPIPEGRTDLERLCSGELVYSGVRRTPLMAVASSIQINHQNCPLAAELFATTLDLYLLSGEIAENPNEFNTANGGPATVEAAKDRLARSLCCDRTELSTEKIHHIAEQLRQQQLNQLQSGLNQVLNRYPEACQTLFLSGEGAFLGKRLCDVHPALDGAEFIFLPKILDQTISSAACAYALAQIAADMP